MGRNKYFCYTCRSNLLISKILNKLTSMNSFSRVIVPGEECNFGVSPVNYSDYKQPDPNQALLCLFTCPSRPQTNISETKSDI